MLKLSIFAFAILTPQIQAQHDREYYEKEFISWMNTFEKQFHKAEEFVHRLNIFQQNDQFIQEHNEKHSDFKLGHNEFSHLSWTEFKSNFFGLNLPSDYFLHRNTTTVTSTINVPDSIDWVAKGGVTDVKNQGQCGSCWAFSTTGAVEGAVFVSSNVLEDLSEQELIDCDTLEDHGCGGGLMDHAFKWIENGRGLCREADYPYNAKSGICALNCEPIVQVTAFTDVLPNSQEALKAAVAQQPVSVAIEADQPAFQFYKSGVFTKACGTKLDHGVLVVGYGTEEGNDFFKVKNSWGNTWGENGYIKLARNVPQIEGQCGVAMVASFPTAHVVQKMKDVVQKDASLSSSAIIETCADTHTCLVNFTSLTVTPDDPKRGHPIHFAGTGFISKAVDTSTFDLQVQLAGEEVFAHKGSMCGDTHIPLPLGLGHINVHGFNCPLQHGRFDTVAVDVNLPIIAPSGNYNIRITSSDNSDQLFCINVKLDLTSSAVTYTSNVYEFM